MFYYATAVTVAPLYDEDTVLQNPLTGFVMYLPRKPVPSDLDKTIFVPDLNQTVMIRDYATTGYIRAAWSNFNPTEDYYAWRDPTNLYYTFFQAARARNFPLAFRFVIDGRDQGQNTPAFVLNAGATYFLADSAYPTRTTPYPQDEIFQYYWTKFMTAFAEDFNDPSFVTFIDAYSMGKWGEAHDVVYQATNSTTYTAAEVQTLKEESVDWFTTLASSLFTKVPIFIHYHRDLGDPSGWTGSARPNTEMMLNNSLAKGFSLRHDAFGMTGYYQSFEKEYVAAQKYQVPVLHEGGWVTDGSMRYWIDPSGDYREGHPEDVRYGEYSEASIACVNMMDFRTGEVTVWFNDTFNLIQSFNQEGGYRLYPNEITIPEQIVRNITIFKNNSTNTTISTANSHYDSHNYFAYLDDDGSEADNSTNATDPVVLTISHSWINKGWAYFPNNIAQWNYKYKVAFALLNQTTEDAVAIFFDSSAEPSLWYQNETNQFELNITASMLNDTTSIPAGTYSWGVGILDVSGNNNTYYTGENQTTDIQLAVDSSQLTSTGWVILSDIEISDQEQEEDTTGNGGGEDDSDGKNAANHHSNIGTLLAFVCFAIVLHFACI